MGVIVPVGHDEGPRGRPVEMPRHPGKGSRHQRDTANTPRLGPMDSEDTVSTRDDVTGDWLWDFEDRYDLGAPDEPEAAGPAVVAGGDPRVTEVKKHVRRRDGSDVSPEVAAAVAAAATAAIEARQDDTRPVPFLARPVAPVGAAATMDPTTVVAADTALFGGDGAPRHFARPQGSGRGHRGMIAAAVGVVLVLGLIGFITRSRGSHSGTPSVALSTPSTATTVVSGPFGVVPTQPLTSDTTAATVPGTPTATTVAAAIPTDSTGGVIQTPAGTTNNSGNTGGTTGGTTRPTTRPTNPPPSSPATTPATTPATAPPPTTPRPTNPPPPTTAPTVVPPPATTVPSIP
jgi:hypothetical protein